MSEDKPANLDTPAFPAWAIELVRCPVTMESLQPADQDLLRELRDRQQAGQLVNHLGAICDLEFDAGLVNESRSFFHPSRHGIQTLIPGEAIQLDA